MIDRFDTFALSVAKIHRCIQKIKSHEMGALGLKGTHVMCLYNLGKSPNGLSASELCAACGEDKAAISRTINELTDKQYVLLNSFSQKRAYRTKFVLTKKGRDTIFYINNRIENIINIIGKDLTENQREDFYKSLAIITSNLQEYVKTDNLAK